MIIMTRMLNMPPHMKWNPVVHRPVSNPTAVWHFAPHMYGNPFQDILYSKFPQHGIETRGHRDIESAVQAVEKAHGNKVLHLHWLNVVLATAKSEPAARRNIEEFRRQLERAKRAGAKIVWTVHNVLPHESYEQSLAIEVRKLAIESADIIHVMSPDTVDQCSGHFDIPLHKVVRVEHPGYHGHYPPAPELNLRRMWGLPQGGKLGVIIGGIKPYKGLNEFAEHFVRATQHRPRDLSLVIAGKAGDEVMHSTLWQLAETSPNLHLIRRMLTDEQVSSLMSAADFTAIPYRNSLNSGALVLGLTFGKPVLARSSAGSTHLLSDGAGKVYESDSHLDTILSDNSWINSATPAALHMSHRLDRDFVTEKFAQVALALVDSGVAAAQAVVGSTGGLRGA